MGGIYASEVTSSDRKQWQAYSILISIILIELYMIVINGCMGWRRGVPRLCHFFLRGRANHQNHLRTDHSIYNFKD